MAEASPDEGGASCVCGGLARRLGPYRPGDRAEAAEGAEMAEPSLEFLGKQIERLQVEMWHAPAEIAALRNRVDAN